MGNFAVLLTSLGLLAGGALSWNASCPDYSSYSAQRHGPYSTGRRALSYMRPAPECRTFPHSYMVNSAIEDLAKTIADPDLYRLFENTFPNTLDTAIKWYGFGSRAPDDIRAFIITGDIDAMWLRDSANQLLSYASLFKKTKGDDLIDYLFRGVIHQQARYILTAPFCNSFQAPAESGIPPAHNSAADSDSVTPPYNSSLVFECKCELDSLAAFLRISNSYYEATSWISFYDDNDWVAAAQTVFNVAKVMMSPTYDDNGFVLDNYYKFTRETRRTTETQANDGAGSPVGSGIGLIRSAFRPSDDSTLFQFNIPSNMMFASQLKTSATIMTKLEAIGAAPAGLAGEMAKLATDLRVAIERQGIVYVSTDNGADGAELIYAYEIDGYGSVAVMDDANIPSLLSAPLYGYLDKADPIYQRTRARILSQNEKNGNPYFMRGPVINAVGSPHTGPGMAWPMASIVRIMTTDDDDEIIETLSDLLNSTDGLGLIHESIDTFNQSHWTRQW